MTLKIEETILKTIQARYPDAEIYNLDTSNIEVNEISHAYSDPNIVVDEEPGSTHFFSMKETRNCTEVDDSFELTYQENRRGQLTIHIENGVNWHSEINAELGLPSGLNLGGKTGVAVDVRGGVYQEIGVSEGITFTDKVPIPSCSEIRVSIEMRREKITGQITFTLEVDGTVSYSVNDGVLWDTRIEPEFNDYGESGGARFPLPMKPDNYRVQLHVPISTRKQPSRDPETGRYQGEKVALGTVFVPLDVSVEDVTGEDN